MAKNTYTCQFFSNNRAESKVTGQNVVPTNYIFVSARKEKKYRLWFFFLENPKKQRMAFSLLYINSMAENTLGGQI